MSVLIYSGFSKVINNVYHESELGSSFVVQQVRDLVLPLKQPGLLLWLGFDPWLAKFYMPWAQPKQNKKKVANGIEVKVPCGSFQELS